MGGESLSYLIFLITLLAVSCAIIIFSINTPSKKSNDTIEILKNSKELALTSDDEIEIFQLIVKKFLHPFLNVQSITPLSKPQEFFDKLERIKFSNEYIYLVRFVKKYGDNYSNEDFNNLKKVLYNKGFEFNNDDLSDLIIYESKEQAYLDFKNSININSPKSFKEFTKNFVVVHSMDFKLLEDFKNFYAFTNNSETSKQQKREEQEESIEIAEINKTFCENGDFVTNICKLVAKVSVEINFFKKVLSEHEIELKDEDENKMDFEDLLNRIIDIRREYKLEKFEKQLLNDNIYSIEDVDTMSGYEFENFLTILFRKLNYTVKHTRLSGDQGADIVIENLEETTIVQAKRCNNKVTNKAVQEVVASINYYKGQKGMVVTNNVFTKSAIELAKVNNIILWDRKKLEDIISQLEINKPR